MKGSSRYSASRRSVRFAHSTFIALFVCVGVACSSASRNAAPPRQSPSPSAPPVHAVPATIAADCSVPVEAKLNAFIASVPDGSLIRFPAGGCYAQARRIEVRDKTNVTIDGQGSTFRSSAPNDGTRLDPNWLVLRGHNLRLQNLTAVGNFNLTGARSQARVNEATIAGVGNQFNAGVHVYGGDGVYISDVKVRNVFGDGIGVNISEYADAAPPHETPRNIHIVRVEATTTARHCFAPTAVSGLWIEDSIGRDCWYGGMDLELDDKDNHQLRDVHLLRNTFDGFFQFGIAVPVAGAADNTRDIEIRDNTFLTPADNACNQILLVGIYPDNPYTFKNVVVEGNRLKFVAGTAIQLDHVTGGSIQNNTLTQVPPKGYTTVQREYCTSASADAVRLVSTTDVNVANNRQDLEQ